MARYRTIGASFGVRLTHYRKKLGLTQTEFAEKHGIAKSTQVSYELNRTVPSAAYLESLRAAGADVAALVDGPTAPAGEPKGSYAEEQVSPEFLAWVRSRLEELPGEVARAAFDSNVGMDKAVQDALVEYAFLYRLDHQAVRRLMAIFAMFAMQDGPQQLDAGED